MGSGIWHIDGTVVQPDMFVLTPFGAVNGNPIYRYDHPFVFRNDYDSSKMYVHILEAGGAEYKTAPAQWDLNDLPGTPTVTDLAQFLMSSATGLSRDQLDVLSVGNFIVYVIEAGPDLRYNFYNVATDTWNSTEGVIAAALNHQLRNPRLAKDDSNYIYLCYEDVFPTAPSYALTVRRSASAMTFPVLNWNSAIPAASSTLGYHYADLAVTGTSGSETTALVYQNPEAATGIELNRSVAQAMNWSGTTWSGSTMTFNFMTSATVALGPAIEFDANGSTLYVVWADNRLGYDEIYGMISYDGGMNFDPEQRLTFNSEDIVETPVIATGTQPGALAIAYVRTGGGGVSPYCLASMPDFYDTCDQDPATTGFWDGYSGVSVDLTVTPVSPPGCYRMATTPVKGQLIHSYGSVEHTGSLDLYFYDSMDMTIGNDFFAGMDNNAVKGIIRMLGVKNDVNPNNYSYSFDGGVTWTTWSGAPRSTGWHRIIMTVDAALGLTMSLEYQPGMTVTATDPSFTAFTDVIIQGDDDVDPYFVDDIQVIAIPVIGEAPIPAASPVSMALMLLGIGGLILWKIRH
ncbi:MAG TPA: hypothetical protein PLV45_08530, partial [bacterium]|nr:hypothetical protein [bacterium]